MELRQLQHFTAVIEHGTVHAAARTFGLSQPAITRSIQNLEEDLQVKLLRREGRHVLPTAAGSAFFQHAQLILNEAARAKNEVSLVESGTTGEVNLGVGTIFSNYIIDEAVLEISAHAPDLSLKVQEGFFEDLTEKLLRGQLDLVFINFPRVKIHPSLQLEHLIELHTEPFVRSGHRLARKRKVDINELIGERWLILDQPHSVSHFEGSFLQAGLSIPRNQLLTNSLNLMKALVLHGDFICYMPMEWFEADIRAGRIKTLHCPQFTLVNQVGIMTRTGQYMTPSVREVIERIKKVCASFGAA
jgi:LysR family transcriptional regulator, regulator of abg operon